MEHYAHVDRACHRLPARGRRERDRGLRRAAGVLSSSRRGCGAHLACMRMSSRLRRLHRVLAPLHAPSLRREAALRAPPPCRGRERAQPGVLRRTAEPDHRRELSGSQYVADLDDHLYAATYLRSWLFEASLSGALRKRHGEAWWHDPAAGETLRRAWSRGQEWNAEDVVAHLGYDRLDWRPVLRQIRTRLIGEMSGYGGPNITTRAGTRKV